MGHISYQEHIWPENVAGACNITVGKHSPRSLLPLMCICVRERDAAKGLRGLIILGGFCFVLFINGLMHLSLALNL